MHLYLIRHGQSFVNLPDADHSKPNEPLTPLGQKQAKAAAQWLKKSIKIGRIYSSTMLRTQQTAEAISEVLELPITYDNNLREVGMNGPDGKSLPEELLSPYREDVWGTLRPYEPITETGENWMQFRTRVGSFIESLLGEFDNFSPRKSKQITDQTILIVCHGGVIEAFYEYIFQKGPWSVVSVITNHTGITHFDYQQRPNRPDWRLYFHNKLDHLTSDLIS